MEVGVPVIQQFRNLLEKTRKKQGLRTFIAQKNKDSLSLSEIIVHLFGFLTNRFWQERQLFPGLPQLSRHGDVIEIKQLDTHNGSIR